jgi:hypothetical protein
MMFVISLSRRFSSPDCHVRGLLFSLKTDDFSLSFQASTVARCFPPAPESGAAPKDYDISKDAKENVEVVKDSDASEEKEEDDDDALFIARRRRTVVDELFDTAESSRREHDDDDADHNLPDARAPEALAAPVSKRSSGFFADEDDLMSDS